MTCETVRPLLSEFQDDQLDAAKAWQVQAHLTGCATCARVSGDLRSVSHRLSALPNRQPSANFEASLAQRLALTRRPRIKSTWQDRLRQAFPGPRLRPALALGVALTSVAAVFLVPAAPPPASSTLAAVRTVDHVFVADCVAQHRRDAAGEPLADVAAQNLAGHLDGSVSPAPASDADAGLF